MEWRKWDRESWLVFGGALAFYAAMAWVTAFVLELFHPDAMARAVHAQLALLSPQPKLSNIGFVWPPLPTLAQLPLLLLPFLRQRGLSGSLVTAFLGAGSLVLLHMVLRHFGVRRWARCIITFIMALNPFIVFYSANGMSEIYSVFFFMLLVYGYLIWHGGDDWRYLVLMALASALWVLTRYEAVFFSAAIGALIAAHLLIARRPWKQIVATELLFWTPTGLGLMVWLAANWAIMGEPFFFATGPYSSGAFARIEIAHNSALVPLRGNLIGSIKSTLDDLRQYAPLALGMPFILMLVALWRRSIRLWLYLVLPLAFWAICLFNWMYGHPLIWVRYYIPAIAVTFVLAAIILGELRPRWLGELLLCLALFATVPLTASRLFVMPDDRGPETNFMRSALGQGAKPHAKAQEIAACILSRAVWRDVLADTSGTQEVLFFTGRPWLFVLPNDSDFDEILAQPYGRVAYVLTADAYTARVLSQVTQAYPELLVGGGISWVEPVCGNAAWNLYRVVADPAAARMPFPSRRLAPLEP